MTGHRTLIDELLTEQGRLTAVEKFSRARQGGARAAARYRDLIPLSAPAPGEQYAFEVDLDRCSGCKACVTACHSLNGLDEGEAWRDTGLLLSADWRRPFQQTVTTTCHHCVDPACLNGCPVLAYDKDPATGIVRHLDDQCIGCQYCIFKCPYEVPRFLPKRGIVRKCDMCHQRLEAGEAPACVQACPHEAIRITLINPEAVRIAFRLDTGTGSPPGTIVAQRNSFLPASPDPAITLPTTRFTSARPLPAGLVPADAAEARLQPPHWPLIWMLVLTQLAAGAFASLAFAPNSARLLLAILGLVAGLVGLSASVLHLGKPLKAWRAFLGLRRSWLSREIVVFGLFMALASASTASNALGTSMMSWAALAGVLGVFCSGMVYHDTQRAGWRGMRSVGRFLGSMVVLGLAAAWFAAEAAHVPMPLLPIALALAVTIKLGAEHRLVRGAPADASEQSWPEPGAENGWALARSAFLLRQPLGLITRLRFSLGVTGGVLAPLLSRMPGVNGMFWASVALTLCLLGELAERYLFFRSVVPVRMPGSPGTIRT